MRRFPIRMDPFWRPFLVPFGATSGRSYAEIEGDRLRVRFGWLFDHTFALADVAGAAPMRWPWFGGIGWRTDLAGTVGLIGSLKGVVGIRFHSRQRVAMVFPRLPCGVLAVSLRDPEGFLAEMARLVDPVPPFAR